MDGSSRRIPELLAAAAAGAAAALVLTRFARGAGVGRRAIEHANRSAPKRASKPAMPTDPLAELAPPGSGKALDELRTPCYIMMLEVAEKNCKDMLARARL